MDICSLLIIVLMEVVQYYYSGRGDIYVLILVLVEVYNVDGYALLDEAGNLF